MCTCEFKSAEVDESFSLVPLPFQTVPAKPRAPFASCFLLSTSLASLTIELCHEVILFRLQDIQFRLDCSQTLQFFLYCQPTERATDQRCLSSPAFPYELLVVPGSNCRPAQTLKLCSFSICIHQRLKLA